MSDGLTKEDARLIAQALLEAVQSEKSTTENSKISVVSVLERAGSTVLAHKIRNTDHSTWSSMWGSIKEFFVDIWEGIVGAAEALYETIAEWLR